MRNFMQYKRCINLIQSMSTTTVRLKHCWAMYLPEKYRMLLPLHNNNVLIKQCLNRLEHFKTFSTTIVLAKSKDRGQNKKSTQPQRIDLREMGEIVNVEKLTEQLENTLEKLKENFIKNVSVRTSAGAIEELQISFDGSEYLLQELAQVSRTPKLVTLNVSAFPQAIPDILNVLTKNQMNLNPQQDGSMIYIPITKVTKEYRENLSKNAKSYFLKSRDQIKEIRNKEIKKVKNIEKLPKDLSFRIQGYIDLFTNQYIAKAETMLETKQKELMG